MSGVFASIDLGGTNIHAALATGEGTVLAELKEPTRSHEGPERVVTRIGEMVQKLVTQSGHKPQALGIGVPGLVDVATGTTRFFPNMPTQWRGVQMRALLEPMLGCTVHLLNDARTATLGEMVFGHGRDAETLIYFGLGTGVGGGVVIDGKLRLGPLGAAGEIGHQTVLPDGPLCGCGNRGCLETLVSAPALSAEGVRLLRSGQGLRLHALTEGLADRVTPETMAAAARSGDEAVALAGDLLLHSLNATLRARVRMFPADSVRVAISGLGDRAGLLGGIALASRGAQFVPQLQAAAA